MFISKKRERKWLFCSFQNMLLTQYHTKEIWEKAESNNNYKIIIFWKLKIFKFKYFKKWPPPLKVTVWVNTTIFRHFSTSLTPSLDQGNTLSLTISQSSLFNFSYNTQSDVKSQHLCRARGPKKPAPFYHIFGIIEQNIDITMSIM